MEINTESPIIAEPVTKSEVLASWDRGNVDQDIETFLSSKEQIIGTAALNDFFNYELAA